MNDYSQWQIESFCQTRAVYNVDDSDLKQISQTCDSEEYSKNFNPLNINYIQIRKNRTKKFFCKQEN